MAIDPGVLSDIDRSIVDGRMMDAWQVALDTGRPLAEWPAGPARRVAARLARALGDAPLARALDWLNWRVDRRRPDTYFHATFSRLSHVPEHRIIGEIGPMLERADSDPLRADLLALRATLAAALRDFEPAFRDIDDALALAGDEAWIHVSHATVLESADRYEEALAAAETAAGLRPRYAAAVLQRAETLVHLGRDDEAIACLAEADRATQNAAFAMRLQALHSEREDHVRALECLDTIEARSPLATKSLRQWLAGRRADFLYMAGDFDGFLEWADRKGEGFQAKAAEKLRSDGARDRGRRRLDVPFTRQHAMTCAPATLASLAAYWQRPRNHLEIAAAICHEGTPWHKERRWCVENGFIAREFRLTAASLRELIDRGIPFTLTTQAATSAHLQACIGYDERIGVVLLRDPTERHFVEMTLEGLLADHPIAGPRAMVMIPPEEASRLDGVVLPDEAVYDAFHDLLVALDGHDPLQIVKALATLRAVGGASPLVLEGEERAASWRDDMPAHLRAIEAQLAIAPDHEANLLQKAYLLRRLGRWDDLRALLEERVARRGSDPVFISELGELLMEDARLLPRAEHFLRKAVRLGRRNGRVYESLARCRAKQQRFAEAADLRRCAATLSAGFEPYALAYFDAARIVRREREALDFLEARTRRSGDRAAGPWITHAEALNRLDRQQEAAAVLERAAAALPGDGLLKLRAGAMMSAWGEPHRSRGLEWMEAARGRVPETEWLEERARTASFLGDRTRALRCWQALVEDRPWLEAAWRGLARCIAEDQGEEAAIRFLEEATRKHPDVAPLWSLLAAWLADTATGPLAALDRFLELDPGDLWGLRERATRRAIAGRLEDAEDDAVEAVSRNPWSAESHGVLGFVREKRGRLDEAAASYRRALELDVDSTYPARRLVRLHDDPAHAAEALRFLEEEMDRQVSNGEIVPEYQQLAWGIIDPPLLMKKIQGFCEERPDLWQTWSARVEQALRMRFDGEALLAARTLTERFPLMPRAWLELARVHRAAGRHPEEEQAAGRAVDLSPGWDEAAREHAHVLEMLGRVEQAVAVLRRACELEPLNAPNHGCLADALRRSGHEREAFDALRDGLEACPFYDWGWDRLTDWAGEDDRNEELGRLVEALSAKHGHHPRWWSIAADAWASLGRDALAESAIRRGLELRPEDADLRDKLAHLHFSRREYDPALRACEAVAGEKKAPVNLRGRHAWILMHSGRPVEGVAAMRALLDEEPDYNWGLSELATWHEERGEWKELRDHSRRWLRASPHNLRALACLGLAEEQLGNDKEARAAYARAHAIEPEYTFVARHLLDLQMKAGELEDAGRTLETLRRYAPGPWITCDAIELALHRGDRDTALAEADRLLADPDAGTDACRWAAELFKKRGFARDWNHRIAALSQGDAPAAPGATAAMLDQLPANQLAKRGPRLVKRHPEDSPARVAAWSHLIDLLSRNGGKSLLRTWANARVPELHRHPRLWNAMARALVDTNCHDEGLKWLDGWEERPDDTTDLTFLCLAAHHDGASGNAARSWQAAAEARRIGLERFPDAPSSSALRAGHALHLAVDGRHAEAREVLENFEPERASDFYQAMAEGARAVIRAAEGDETGARTHLARSSPFFARYTDRGTTAVRLRVEGAVAAHLPWARGRVGRLRKRWQLPREDSRIGTWISENSGLAWGLALLGFFLIRGCAAAISG